MILLHAAPVSDGAIGGPHVSVPSLTAAQNGLDGVIAGLLVTSPAKRKPSDDRFPVFPHQMILGEKGRIGLPAPFDAPDLVVFHSTYIPVHATIARRLRDAGIPYVICPRGGMTRYAQRQKWLKKRLGNLLFFGKLVARSKAVHCLTEREASASRGWHRPVVVEGNGVYPPDEVSLASPGRSPRRRIIFLGRLAVRIKGLDLLLDACADVRSELIRRGAKVELYGPDDRGSTAWLTARIAHLGLKDVIAMYPPVMGESKTLLLARADAFLHTSRSEGHPQAVLEALSFGLPCLVTPGTNVADELAAAEAGWVVEPSAASIAEGLRRILDEDDDRLRRLGANAREFAVSRYHWRHVAARTTELYRRCVA
jgi:glycosyltransferase involved in cell wall biosynthesis